jgi:iron complex transport system ATP-binding protein
VGRETKAQVIRALAERDFKVTAGVLNVLDSDYEVAIELCEEVVCEATFSSISLESHEKNLELIERGNAVVLTDVPICWGNVKNLEAVNKAVKMGKRAYLMETRAGFFPGQSGGLHGAKPRSCLTTYPRGGQGGLC